MAYSGRECPGRPGHERYARQMGYDDAKSEMQTATAVLRAQVARLEAANVAKDTALREELAQRIDALGSVMFAGDDKERQMLPKSVVLTVIRQAPLSDGGEGWLPPEVREQAAKEIDLADAEIENHFNHRQGPNQLRAAKEHLRAALDALKGE